MLSLVAALLASAQPGGAPPPVVAPPSEEIVVTAKHDKCFVEYGQHPVSDAQLETLSQSWAAGTPVRVIEPRGASIRCEFHIMQSLAKHGAHMAQFVARSEDVAGSTQPPPKPAVVTSVPKAQPERRTVEQIVRAEHPPAMFGTHSIGSVRSRGSTTVAAGSPSSVISLVCTMNDPARPYELDVEVDEGRATATPFRPDTGGGGEMKADFMPQAVRFGPFTIDRSTLRIQRESGGTGASGPPVDGQCRLASRKRVF
jgi:hypothetical protein